MTKRFERGEVVGGSIPDDDMPGWIEVIREMGLSQQETDRILSQLNKTYAEAKGQDLVEKELATTVKYLKETYNRELSSEQIEYLRRGIEERLKPKS